jgi:1-hydroxycarotenoid 3,4-desaturase
VLDDRRRADGEIGFELLDRRDVLLQRGAVRDGNAFRGQPIVIGPRPGCARAGGADVAHVGATLDQQSRDEQRGVWLVGGGMQAIARALADGAARKGASVRYETSVDQITIRDGRARGVRLASGEQLEADAILANIDAGALAAGLLGPDAVRAIPRGPGPPRSFAAVTWAIAANVRGFPLAHHNVIFSRDYAAEFGDLIEQRRLPREPTVYLCAQDRDDAGRFSAGQPAGAERLLAIVNAPAVDNDMRAGTCPAEELAVCETAMMQTLGRAGLEMDVQARVTTPPAGFSRLFPGSRGALYGAATHGWRASFQRPAARGPIPGLYLAGGSIHPGPGLAMAALSGRMAAESLLADRPSIRRSRRVAMPGGTSMR